MVLMLIRLLQHCSNWSTSRIEYLFWIVAVITKNLKIHGISWMLASSAYWMLVMLNLLIVSWIPFKNYSLSHVSKRESLTRYNSYHPLINRFVISSLSTVLIFYQVLSTVKRMMTGAAGVPFLMSAIQRRIPISITISQLFGANPFASL